MNVGAEAVARAMSPRTRKLLQGPTLLSMAWPNVVVMLAQAATGLNETWWVALLGGAVAFALTESVGGLVSTVTAGTRVDGASLIHPTVGFGS